MPTEQPAPKPRVKKDKEFYANIGRMGGNKTKKLMLAKNPNYYSDIGLLGGDMMKNTRGRAFYSEIGKMSKRINEPAV